jgi:superfamily II DNA or RNA helicase
LRLVYDRGTVLIPSPPHAVDLVRSLPGAVWDPRVRAYRAPAHRLGELRRALAGQVELAVEDLRAGGPAPGAWSGIDLRPYQEAALTSWELSHRRGLVVLPTGSGKTRLALAAMARTRLRTLCLVPTRVLLHQWRAEIAKVYPGPVGCLGDGTQEVAAITVATFESAYRSMARIGNRFELVVVDEAHHFGCGVRDEILEMAVADARLGLTATPLRGGEPGAQALTALIGPTVFELAIGDLAGTFLASFDLYVLELDLTRDERRAHDADMKTFRDVHARFRDMVPGASWADFARAASKSPEGRSALAAWRRVRKLLAFTRAKADVLATLLRRHRSSRVLVFTADNEAAYAIARRHLIMPVTCDIGRRERDDALARFRRGELRALVSARVLNEGLDVPDADVAIVVGGALGEREHVQRVGRTLRPGPGKRAAVYELVTRATIEARQARRRRASLGIRCVHPL